MTTAPATTTRPCDASHNYNNGVGCELDADHRGMHRHGEHDRQVVYWSTPFDLSTRAELVVELALFERLGELATRPRPQAFWNPTVANDPEFVPPVHARLREATSARIQTRIELILETLYGPDALEPVGAARARIQAGLRMAARFGTAPPPPTGAARTTRRTKR